MSNKDTLSLTWHVSLLPIFSPGSCPCLPSAFLVDSMTLWGWKWLKLIFTSAQTCETQEQGHFLVLFWVAARIHFWFFWTPVSWRWIERWQFFFQTTKTSAYPPFPANTHIPLHSNLEWMTQSQRNIDFFSLGRCISYSPLCSQYKILSPNHLFSHFFNYT